MAKARGPNRLTRIKSDYEFALPGCQRLAKALREQLDAVVRNEGLKLAAEPETRIKTLESIHGKMKRKGRKILSFSDVKDVVGLRYVFLFGEDAGLFSRKIAKLLTILEYQDARDRLPTTHFGYRSDHFVVRIPNEWAQLPAHAGLGELTAEIQVRTMAQHLWAVASHLLQYKSEESVPAPLRRSLSRVAALLELVDSELSRVRAEKKGYEESIPTRPLADRVMTLEEAVQTIREVWPAENQSDDENMPELYRELLAFGVTSTGSLSTLLHSERDATLTEDKKLVNDLLKDFDQVDDDDATRLRSGVYFTHAGLTRIALQTHLKEHRFLKPFLYEPD